MEIIIVTAFAVLFFLVIMILVKLYSNKTADYSAQMLDLKNQINDLKTKQLENQQASQFQQTKFISDTLDKLNGQIQQKLAAMDQNLNSNQSNITKQLSSSNQIIGDIHNKLGNLEVTAKNIQNIGKDISSLQNILQAPKLRGNLGEYLLEDLLNRYFQVQITG